MHKVLKDEFFLNPVEDNEDSFESIRTHLLIVNSNGIFGLYSLRSVQEYSKYYAFGSGFELALGAMYAVYNNNISAENIAKIALNAAVEFDSGSAGPFEIYKIELLK